ncbi:MAG: hypothetical protein NTZ65_02400 [Candidatus Berkelbacteria bacterium]|nr:hypothetical protein [Candidatus Berkelbacteria bacterium]
MATKLSAKGLRIVSHSIITFFAVVSLCFFLFSIDRTALVSIISIGMLAGALFISWDMDVVDAVGLLIFFFGTTACFNFFNEVVLSSWSRIIAIVVFAGLSLILSNYLLNTVSPEKTPDKQIYKVSLAIVFTEIFWILSFINASQISKGAITAVIFFNLLSVSGEVLSHKFQLARFASLVIISIILLALVIYRI